VAEDGRTAVVLFAVDPQQFRHQSTWLIVVHDASTGLLLARRQDAGDQTADPAGARQNADELAFVVGNRKFAQCAAAAPDERHDVGTANVDDLAPHQTTAGEDQDVVIGRGRLVLVGVLAQAQSG